MASAITNQGRPITLNARSDLKGSLSYQARRGLTYSCKGYNRYLQTTVDHHTLSQVDCEQQGNRFQGEVRYFVHVEAIDRAGDAPGDELCIVVKRWPGRLHPVLIRDCGPIQSGNVRIRAGVTSGTGARGGKRRRRAGGRRRGATPCPASPV